METIGWFSVTVVERFAVVKVADFPGMLTVVERFNVLISVLFIGIYVP